jgi:hypothetical protein
VTSGTQVHDYNLDINPFPNGLFWTSNLDSGEVTSNVGAGRASYSSGGMPVQDYFNITNALSNGPSVPGTVKFNVEWSGVTSRGHVSDPVNRFSLRFVQTGASINWSGTNTKGARFTADSTGQTVGFAQIAHERNGVFFTG